jgi:hypothetical protein
MKWFLKTSPLRIKKPFEILILKIPKAETANSKLEKELHGCPSLLAYKKATAPEDRN